MSPIPVRCPYTYGDRVTMHGYRGSLRRTGFTGTVEGYYGGTILGGTTDDGEQWTETWGGLYPEDHDIAAATDGYQCACHYRPWPKGPDGAYRVPQSDHGPGGIHYRPSAVQLDLFAPAVP